jgi:hypothetical protein
VTAPLPSALLNAAAEGLKDAFTHVGLLDGGVELAGGDPAYARKPLSYSSTVDGDWVGNAVFDVPPDTTVDGVGFYTGGSGGAPVHAVDLATPEVYGGQGVYELDVIGDVDSAP